MAFFSSLFLLFLGVLAAPQLVTSRQPDAKGIIDSITPYVEWIGIVAGVWGIWTVADAVIHLGLIRWSLIAWLTWLGVGAVLLILGFLLGYSVLQQVFFRRTRMSARRPRKCAARWRRSVGVRRRGDRAGNLGHFAAVDLLVLRPIVPGGFHARDEG